MERFADRYLLLRSLGRGGMGEVFLARDLGRGTECALKRLTADAPEDSAELFRKEFARHAAVHHPAIAQVYERGVAPDGTHYITMEYVPGLHADHALVAGDWNGFAFVATRVAAGLEALHAAGVLHGDLKPSNILVVPASAPGALPSSVRIVDFGLAGLIDRDAKARQGTPGYVAPEVVRGQAPDVASDLYGLGATLYHMAAGRAPYADEKPQAILRRQQEAPPPALPLEEAGCPQPMIELILRLLAVSAGERPQSAGEVRREIERIAPAARLSLADRLASAVVVGRERELGLIERRLAETDRRTRVLLLSGEPGAGKSSLLRELATRAALRDRSVIHCSGASAPAQGAAAIEVLRLLAAGAPDDEGDRAVRERLSDPDATLTEREVSGLVDAAVGWMRGGAGARMFLLDDAEQMDALSRTIVRRLMLHPDAPPALWVLARRGDAQALAEDEALMIRGGAAQYLPLRDLERDSVARLVASRLAETPPPALVEFLWNRAAGHPGLTVELLRNAAEAGAVRETESGLALDRKQLEALRTVGSFEDSLIVRVHALPEGVRTAARALAIWNRPISPERLRAMEPAADHATLEGLLASGLAARDESGRLALRPPALAARIVAATPEEAAVRLHRALLAVPDLSPAERFEHLRVLGEVEPALAEAERVFADGPDVKLAVAAAELAAQSRPAEAAAWLDRAAHEMFQRGRVAEVIPLAERALELEPEGEARFERWVLLARAQQRLGRGRAALKTVETALAAEPPPIHHARLLLARSSAFRTLRAIGESFTSVLEAEAVGRKTSNDEVLAGVALNRSSCLFQSGEILAAIESAQSALAIARRSGDAGLEIIALGNLSLCAFLQGRRDDSIRIAREAVATARGADDAVALQHQLSNLGSLLTEAGEWRAGLEAQKEAFRVSMERGLDRTAAFALANIICTNALSGRPRKALELSRAAKRLVRAYFPMGIALLLRGMATAWRATGHSKRALTTVRRAVREAEAASGPTDREWLAIEMAMCLMVRGAYERAFRIVSRQLEVSTNTGSAGHGYLVALSGIAAIRCDDMSSARAALETSDHTPKSKQAPYALAAREMLRSILAAHAGDRDTCIRAADAAFKAFDRLPAPRDRAWAACEISRVAVDVAEPPAQNGLWLEGAARIFERLGDHRSRARGAGTLRFDGCGDSGTAARNDSDDEHRLIEQVGAMLASFSEPRRGGAAGHAHGRTAAGRRARRAADHRSREQPVDPGCGDWGARRRRQEGSAELLPSSREASHGERRWADHGRCGHRPRLELAEHSKSRAALDRLRSRAPGRSRDRCDLPRRFAAERALSASRTRACSRAFPISWPSLSSAAGTMWRSSIANERLVDENLALRRQVGERHQMDVLVGVSTQMRRVIAEVEQAASNDARVLITGEMGTGKELVARTLHYRSKRRLQPFVMLNCGAITESLLASELFGILPNVATDVKARPGRFVEANGGTLFLDEIGEMPMAQQVALLSVLSSPSTKCEVVPVGGGKPVPVDVRVIAATNQDLHARIREGRFREDLYYRLAVIPIEIPPLRERKADIQPLAARFLKDLAAAQERPVPEMSPEFVAALLRSDWPGNVRELQNYVERVLSMTPGKTLPPETTSP